MAFLVYITSFALCAGSAVFIAGNVGMGNMQQIATRLQSGQLAPAKAYQLITKALGHPGATDLFADEAAPVPADPTSLAQADPGVARPLPSKVALATKQDPALLPAQARKASTPEAKPAAEPVATSTVNAKTEAAAPAHENNKTPKQEVKNSPPKAKAEEKQLKAKPNTPIPNINNVPPDPLAQKPKKPEPNTVRVRMDKMSHYVGHYFIVTLKNGTEQRGLLRQVRNSDLILDRKLYGGNIQFKIRKSQVKTIRMLTRLPDER